MKKLLLLALLAFAGTAYAQKKPRLIVGIVVDQMRYDYLYRFQSEYGPDGFKRLLGEGLSCENTHYDYLPTYTGPGHACIYTGATPSINGVIANDWFEKGKTRYVTADARYKTVGAPGKVGQHSPAVMLTTTITDELRLGSNMRSKVVGVCLKDRGSILPAGHIANAAYWFDDATGRWITSTYYPDSLALPQWVQDFNARKLPEQYTSKVWDRLPGVPYSQSDTNWAKYDKGRYAASLTGGFPHNLPAVRAKMGLGAIRFTPFGNTLTLDFALEALEKMQMGDDDDTDFLCLSFSSTDYCTHQYGVHSPETEDIYIRLDQDIARLLQYLDRQYGRDEVLVFLTADHGGGETPARMRDLNIPAGVFAESKLDSNLNAYLKTRFSVSADLVAKSMNQQVWLQRQAIDSLGLKKEEIESATIEWLNRQNGVYAAFSRDQAAALPAEFPAVSLIRKGIHPRRSGDIIFQLQPGWHPDDSFFGAGGATHGTSYAYDTHVPLVWYGSGIRPGVHYAPVSVTDITPTLAAWLRIMEPNGCTGKVIERVLQK